MPLNKVILFLILFLLSLIVRGAVSAATSFTKYIGNPVFSPGPPGSWDSRYVANPSLLKLGGGYKMWYEANEGSGLWKIGHTSSIDGITGWTRFDNPIITIGSIDGWEAFITDPRVIFDSVSSTYKMWYSSVNAGWIAGNDRFRLKYATSADGINWTQTEGWVFYGTPGAWDSGGPNRGNSVIFKDGIYHLWYAGTHAGTSWRIGYATSPDGLVWTKQNGGNPVVTPTQPWEFNHVSFPTVLYEDGMYKMWYASGFGDAPTDIVYATSLDGINWTKPADENPVITRTPGTFDSTYLTITGILQEPGHHRLYYSGFNGSNWAIGLATSTSIPTPAPVPTNKVVIIPGMGASWNADAILNCKRDDYSGDWSLASFADKTYLPLYESIESSGIQTAPYYYDWRKQIISHTNAVKNFIGGLTTTNERVHVIGHSMGGLLARAYLEQETVNHKIDKLLTAGSPHQGSVLSYPGWSAGDVWDNNIIHRIAITTLLKRCGGLFGNDRETIRSVFPSVQNLLPLFNFLQPKGSDLFIPVGDMDAKNNWLPTSSFPPFWGATVGTLSGTGEKTLASLEVTNPNKHDQSLGNWLDGKAFKRNESWNGDGTVLAMSSQLTGAENRFIQGSHSDLVSSQEGITSISDFLGISATAVTSSTSPESALIIIGFPGLMWVEDPDGNVVRDRDSLVSFINPKKGSYKMRLVPKTVSTLVIVGQFLPNGKTLWKEYTFKNILPKFVTIRFDPDNPAEDTLR